MSHPFVFETVVGPAAWASYFINGDATGLEPGEEAQADAWLAWHGAIDVVDCGDETWFASNGDAWHTTPFLAGDVCEYTLMLEHNQG